MSIQKRAWLIVACCLLFPVEGLAQEELPGPRWGVARAIDAITDEKRIEASLDGQTVETSSTSLSFEDYQRNKGFSSTIRISCGPRTGLSVQITAPDNRPVSGSIFSRLGQVNRDVIVRFDSGEPEVEQWSSSPGWGGCVDIVSLDSWDEKHLPYAFLERLATSAHSKLAVRTTSGDLTWTAVFDTSEAAPVAQEVLVNLP